MSLAKSTVVAQGRRTVPSLSKIVDEHEKEVDWSAVLKSWKLPLHIKHFPAANPMSIEHTDFKRLAEEDFLAALKTDGVRYLLLLTTKPNSSDPIALMVDRTQTFYEVEIWANEDFFEKGSLFDGELVWENNTLTYLIFDVILCKGVLCTRLSYRERVRIVHSTVLCVSSSHSDDSVEQMLFEENKFLARNNAHDMCVVPKKCVPKAHLQTLWEERVHCNHRNDGIIFTLNTAPVEIGTTNSILKWKPLHSIDVFIALVDNDWRIFANSNNSSDMVDITDTRVNDHLLRLAPNRLIELMRVRQPCVVECAVVIKNNDCISLVAERERTDKPSPNTLNTISATIRNVQESITSKDLMRLVCDE